MEKSGSPGGQGPGSKEAQVEPAEFIVVANLAWSRALLLPQSARRSLAPLSFPFSLQTLLSRLLDLLQPVRIQPLTPTLHLFRFLRVQASPLRGAFHWSVP